MVFKITVRGRDNFLQARSHNNDQRRYLYLDQHLRKTGPYQDWDGWCIRQTAGNFTLTGQDAGILV